MHCCCFYESCDYRVGLLYCTGTLGCSKIGGRAPPGLRSGRIPKFSDLGLWGTRDIADRGARGVRGVSKTSASITDPVHDISDTPELKI